MKITATRVPLFLRRKFQENSDNISREVPLKVIHNINSSNVSIQMINVNMNEDQMNEAKSKHCFHWDKIKKIILQRLKMYI